MTTYLNGQLYLAHADLLYNRLYYQRVRDGSLNQNIIRDVSQSE